ncbi:MAG TPA: hypothetical protein VFE47_18350 [Tepidisphaeraceae bacterium]|nr:hypothetical protein [Tepidisphaeraceae bacterium]
MNNHVTSPSRRQVLATMVGAGAAAAIGPLDTPARAQPSQPPSISAIAPQLQGVRDALLAKARALVDLKLLTRDDGSIYTVDAAQLMIVFAQMNEADGYRAMREHAEKNLIIDDPNESFTRGFVAWKWKNGQKPDASGTTEALRLARGLWLGAKAFNRPADGELARKILAGYARHATSDQGIWFIRNYYNFATHSFASNSYLVDYDPDFLHEVAAETNDAALAKLADDSYAVVKMAVAPSGLLYDIIQPEVATLYPELNVAAFSPNDIVQFSNCCTTATTVTTGHPEIARKILAIAMNRLDDLRTYYLGRTAEPFNAKSAAVTEFSVLSRLAANLGAEDAAATIADRAMNDWKWCVKNLDTRQVFTLTEILQAMNALLGMGK